MAKEVISHIEDVVEQIATTKKDLFRDLEIQVSEKVNALTLCDCTGECSCADTCGSR